MSNLNPVLLTSKEVYLNEVSAPVVVFDSNQTPELTLYATENTSGKLIIFVKGHENLNVNFIAQPYSNYSLLWIYDEAGESLVVENIELQAGAELKYYIAEVSQHQVKRQTEVHLIGAGANLEFKSASIATAIIEWQQHVVHHAQNTYAFVQNYGMVYENAQFLLDVKSHILKGMKRSETHQQNRIMNMNEKPRARVFPQLIIDENDVKASHAATVGQPDPNEIYYMQSRGLPYSEAIRLLSLGYIMPVLEIVKDEALFESLRVLFEEKVLAHA